MINDVIFALSITINQSLNNTFKHLAMLQTTITKKAAAIISTFNKREMDVYNTGIGYIQSDMEHIVKCDREIRVYESDNAPKYRAAIENQTKMTFRAKYLLQCLDLYVYDNFEDMTVLIKTISDK